VTPVRQLRSGTQVVTSPRAGLLPEVCIFCAKKEKRSSQTREKLSLVQTESFQENLVADATVLGDVRILQLIQVHVDLTAKEGRYHNSCRKDYAKLAVAKAKSSKEKEVSDRNRTMEIRKHSVDLIISFLQLHVVDNKEVYT